MLSRYTDSPNANCKTEFLFEFIALYENTNIGDKNQALKFIV